MEEPAVEETTDEEEANPRAHIPTASAGQIQVTTLEVHHQTRRPLFVRLSQITGGFNRPRQLLQWRGRLLRDRHLFDSPPRH